MPPASVPTAQSCQDEAGCWSSCWLLGSPRGLDMHTYHLGAQAPAFLTSPPVIPKLLILRTCWACYTTCGQVESPGKMLGHLQRPDDSHVQP